MASNTGDASAEAGPVKTILSFLVGMLIGGALVFSIVSRDLTVSVRPGVGGSSGGLGVMMGLGIVLFLAILIGTWIVYQLFLFADR
ncbi:MAG: hypothetical protein R3324_17825 [Halobacteriales archaeon]|nr:hypothetical protein [Halobacteriales archaeon]